jgi:hypothetical protein
MTSCIERHELGSPGALTFASVTEVGRSVLGDLRGHRETIEHTRDKPLESEVYADRSMGETSIQRSGTLPTP